MRPNRIILVRHGESEGNVDKSIYAHKPDHALKLTERGREQARNAGRKVREMIGDETVHFWVSPYRRTRMTLGEMLEAFSQEQVLKAYEHFGLREQDWGHFRERSATDKLEQERDRYGSTFYRFAGGESVAEVWDRMDNLITTLWRDFDNDNYTPQNVVLVTHGRTMRVFCTRYFHWSVEYSEELKNPDNCEIWVMGRNTDEPHSKFRLLNEPAMHKDVPKYNDLLKSFRDGGHEPVGLPTA